MIYRSQHGTNTSRNMDQLNFKLRFVLLSLQRFVCRQTIFSSPICMEWQTAHNLISRHRGANSTKIEQFKAATRKQINGTENRKASKCEEKLVLRTNLWDKIMRSNISFLSPIRVEWQVDDVGGAQRCFINCRDFMSAIVWREYRSNSIKADRRCERKNNWSSGYWDLISRRFGKKIKSI